MPATKRWWSQTKDGILRVRLKSWGHFDEFVAAQLVSHPTYVYRGHASHKWRLESTLDRLLRGLNKLADPVIRPQHLDRFRLAVRGRRGANPVTLAKSDELWALGQHYGLATPLLDWTWSPYVAAYFAFADVHERPSKYRTVFGLNTRATGLKSEEILAAHTGTADPQTLRTIQPLLDENVRLVSQGGLFTLGPDGTDVEEWVRTNFQGQPSAVLVRIDLPGTERAQCLRALNRMNINHLSLFPEVYGSARYCNYCLEIENY